MHASSGTTFQSHVGGKMNVPWGHRWRSSDAFIVSTLSLAVFTDELLFAFMVPLLPTILEHRIGLDASFTQKYTSIFLAEGALVYVVSSPFIGSIADAISSKKVLLLALLVLTLVSIVCLSLTTTLVWLFVGRTFQCIVSNALWIVGMATLTENMGSEHMGKITGLTSALTAAGTIAGPVLAGLLFGIGGYWFAWAGAAGFLVVDTIMRLLMVEKKKPATVSRAEADQERREGEPLLPDSSPPNNGNDGRNASSQEIRGWRFYSCLLRQSRLSTGLLCYYIFALLIACFESTLAVHVRSAFDWGALPVGLLLASIQGPRMLLAPPVGWLKDRFGSRIPTAIGLLSLVPFLFLLGVPGGERFPWVNVGSRGKIIYALSMAMLGCLTCLLNGVGMMEATETIDLLEARQPGIFGPHGGYSRAIALTSMVWAAGLLTGPLLAGLVVELFGYFELQCLLAVICFIASPLAMLFLGSHSKCIEE
ncbi:major facilitator superfamily domain-containing protein [Aspergillus cavernicola]|uniref:Major facilitator superfamily domain-containing protein n=1 Tax=Aspergillus cavernicola TaxID=176166 RepID=A0ABR4ILU7_9EURO